MISHFAFYDTGVVWLIYNDDVIHFPVLCTASNLHFIHMLYIILCTTEGIDAV